MELKSSKSAFIFRWCERCTFTSRCAVYEDKSDLSPEELDVQNEAFWNKIADNFKNAMEMLQEVAKEQGIEITSISPEEEQQYNQKRKKRENSLRIIRLVS